MGSKLIVEVRRVREGGWVLPRFRSCMHPPVRGLLRVAERYVPELRRHARVADLLDPKTAVPVAGVLSLLDATLIQAHGDTFTITGIERVQQGMREIDFAQTWLIDPVDLID